MNILLMVILADHLEVPSRTLCLMLFMCWTWIILVTLKSFRISSKISGLFLSRIFILSFMAMMMCCVRSSAPVLELFSAAPEDGKVGGSRKRRVSDDEFHRVKVKRKTRPRNDTFQLC